MNKYLLENGVVIHANGQKHEDILDNWAD